MGKRYLWLVRIVDVVFAIILVFLGLRFVLKLFGANEGTSFVQWIYNTTQPLLGPFIGIFPAPVLEGGFAIEFTTLFAILIYALIQIGILALIRWLGRDDREYY